MKEHPIIFSGPMVRAILEGRKTMTRRLAKRNKLGELVMPCAVGDHLWVREAFYNGRPNYPLCYRADGEYMSPRWKPSIFMPRALSRIGLEVTAIRLERLRAISDADVLAEGVEISPSSCLYGVSGVVPFSFNNSGMAFAALWESIHGPGSWDRNPLVWAIGFKRV